MFLEEFSPQLGFLEQIPEAMKPRPRIAVKKSRASKEEGCPCADIVTGLILCNIPQFTEVMPASDGVVKIPDEFALEHRNMIGIKVSLEPEDAEGRVFEVRLSTRMVRNSPSALLFERGWQEFRSESWLREGDLLIFALVGMSQFVVYILRGHLEIARRSMASLFAVPNPFTRTQARKSSTPKRIMEKDPDETVEGKNLRPYFGKRLHANAFAKGQRNFEFPQAFLRLHASEVGDTVEFVVPTKGQVWPIETVKYDHEKYVRRVFLCKGWLQFAEGNELREGDLLAIALIANSKFLVTVVERASYMLMTS